MKKFFLKLLLFSILIFGIGIGIWLKTGNSVYTNPYLVKKLNHIKKQNEYNAIFIGSSKINNQINPAIIDRLNPELKTYNLGANGAYNLDNFNTINEILAQDHLKIKLIVLELQNKIEFTKTNINTQRSFSVLGPDNVWFALQYHWQNKKYKQIAFTLYSSILNILHFKKGKNEFTEPYIEKIIVKNGFFPLELDKNPVVKQRRKDLLNKPEIIIRRVAKYRKDTKKYVSNKILEKKLKEINQKCKAHNVKLMLLIPAPAEPDAKELLVYQELKEISLISMINPDEYSEFYQLENRWDNGHLNYKGANILSEKVGQKLKALLK